MTRAEVVTVVGPVTTLAGALGGVWLTLRYQRGRERRDAKRIAYVQWVQFAENLGAWVFQPGADLGSFIHDLQDRMAELDLVGSRKVRQAVRAYFVALEPVNQQVGALAQQFDPRVPLQQHATEIGRIYRAMDPHREDVLKAMRRDLHSK
jgi:hypothetical protein